MRAWQSKGWSELQMSNMQLLSSLAILINSLDCQAHNRSFRLVCINLSSLCSPNAEWSATDRRMVADQSLILWQPVADWFSNFNDDPKFTRRPIGEWLAIGWRLVCNWSATDCRSKIWSVIGCRWLSMVVGCHWSATGCRYSVTVALDIWGKQD